MKQRYAMNAHACSKSFLVVFLLTMGGCGYGDRRETVRGTVALDASPVVQGTVAFEAVQDGDRRSTGTIIVNGQFELPKTKGVLPGKYLVRVAPLRPTGRKVGSFGKEIDEAGLVAIRETDGVPVTVTAGGPNQFEIQVNSVKR
jgi:hypothetical protein